MKLSFKQTPERKVFFTSDLHLNHDPKSWSSPIWAKRGFGSVAEMNEAIIKSINDNVRENDILINLGDFSLNSSREDFYEFLRRINCRQIYSLWGNHPSPIRSIYAERVERDLNNRGLVPMDWNGARVEIYPYIINNMILIGDYAELIVDKQYICASHFPLAIWNEQKHFAWCVTGHSHGGYPETTLETIDKGKILDVGWDVFRRPISFEEVKKIMDKKKYIAKDDHH